MGVAGLWSLVRDGKGPGQVRSLHIHQAPPQLRCSTPALPTSTPSVKTPEMPKDRGALVMELPMTRVWSLKPLPLFSGADLTS